MRPTLQTPDPMRTFAIAGAVALLTACGGGGGSDSPAAPSATPAPTTPTAPSSGTTTALKDNQAGANATFSSFESNQVSVPVDRVAFAGSRRFVKLARADGAVLFLGEVAAHKPFSMAVDAPLDQRRFTYEIFSESGTDAIVRGEVSL